MMRRSLAIFVFFLMPCGGAAEEVSAVPQPATIEEADAQRERASEMRKEAKARYARESQACYEKILVSNCLEDAKKRQNQALVQARHLDAPARQFQQEHRRMNADAENKRKEAERRTREAEQIQQAEGFHAKSEQEAATREQKMTERQRKIAEARRKNAHKAAQRQEREKSREARDARRAAKKARRKAERDAQIEARTPKP